MKPATRMMLNRWLTMVDIFGAVALAITLLAMIGAATFLLLTPALPVILTVTEKSARTSTPPSAGASPRFYQGDDIKGQRKK